MRARVNAGRRRRAVAGVVATVLALAGSYTATRSFDGGARPALEPGVASDPCPSQMTPVNPNRVNADVGGFAGVGGNPVAVTLCRYERDGDGLRLDTARTDVDVKGGDLTVPLDALAELCRAQGCHLDPTPRW